jgi:hypothetical protein
VEQRGGDAGTGGSEGMTECDASAVDVELAEVDAEFAVRDHLGGEGFVDVDEVDVVDGEPRPWQARGGWLRRVRDFGR